MQDFNTKTLENKVLGFPPKSLRSITCPRCYILAFKLIAFEKEVYRVAAHIILEYSLFTLNITVPEIIMPSLKSTGQF